MMVGFETKPIGSQDRVYELSFTTDKKHPLTLPRLLQFLTFQEFDFTMLPGSLQKALGAVSFESLRVGWCRESVGKLCETSNQPSGKKYKIAPDYLKFIVRLEAFDILERGLRLESAELGYHIARVLCQPRYLLQWRSKIEDWGL